MATTDFRRIRITRFDELAYEKQGPGLWRILDTETNEAIGPHYATRDELLCDLPRFHAVNYTPSTLAESEATEEGIEKGIDRLRDLHIENARLRAALTSCEGHFALRCAGQTGHTDALMLRLCHAALTGTPLEVEGKE